MKTKTGYMLMSMIVIVLAIFTVALIIGELTPPKITEAQSFKTYQIRILGDFKGVMKHGFDLKATEFFETWEGGYYRFTLLNGDQVYYPVNRTIVTVKK